MATGREAFAAYIDKACGSLLKPAMRERLLNNDLEALRVLTQDRSSIAEVLASNSLSSTGVDGVEAILSCRKASFSRIPV
jgi:hypothetical protein